MAAAQAALESAQTALSQFESSSSSMSVSAAQSSLDAANAALASAEAAAEDTAAQQIYDDTLAQIDLEAKAQEVADAQALVDTLESKAAAVQVVSLYNGTIQSVNIAAGDTTEPDSVLVVVELTEKGYTVTMGQQLSFSVGDKNASYDVVVPSAAIHTDADGSFVYTVQAKSSPLGNRYVVRKTSVEVIASDDSLSAVSGTLSTADFVITTATVPLEPGDQVRIAE